MGNRNKRGLRKKTNFSQPRKMNGDRESSGSQKSGGDITSRNTRSSGSASDTMVKPPLKSTKELKKTSISQDLAEFKKEFQDEISALKQQMKETQEENQRKFTNSLTELQQENENLNVKYEEKKNEAATLKTENQKQREEIAKLTKNYEDSLKAIVAENKIKFDEMKVLKQNVEKLNIEKEQLNDNLKSKERQNNESIESLKEKYDAILKNQEKEHESALSTMVPKHEYNHLYDEYEKVKMDLQEMEKKLDRVTEAKKMVEKSKLEVIRQKEHQKNEMMEFIRNCNRQNKAHAQPNNSYTPFKFRTHQKSKFGDYSSNEEFSKRFKRY